MNCKKQWPNLWFRSFFFAKHSCRIHRCLFRHQLIIVSENFSATVRKNNLFFFFLWQPLQSIIWDQCTTISGATGTPILDLGTLDFAGIATFHHPLDVHPTDPKCGCLTLVIGRELVKPCHWLRSDLVSKWSNYRYDCNPNLCS